MILAGYVRKHKKGVALSKSIRPVRCVEVIEMEQARRIRHPLFEFLKKERVHD